MDEMMRRLCGELHRAACKELGVDHPCIAVLARAAATGANSADIEAAQTAMDGLTVDVRDALIARAHLALRSDLSPYGIQPDLSVPKRRTLS